MQIVPFAVVILMLNVYCFERAIASLSLHTFKGERVLGVCVLLRVVTTFMIYAGATIHACACLGVSVC